MPNYQIQYRFSYFSEAQWKSEGFNENQNDEGYENAVDAYDTYLHSHYAIPSNPFEPREYSRRIVDLETGEVLFLAPGTAEESRFSRIEFRIPEVAPKTKNENEKTMIKVGITREKGKLMLVVNAKEFHEELDNIGCTHTGEMYDHRPAAGSSVVNGRFEMSTDCLLRREYPAKFDLSGCFSSPPTEANLRTLCTSAHAAGRKIFDHYQPIDITIDIQKKLIKS